MSRYYPDITEESEASVARNEANSEGNGEIKEESGRVAGMFDTQPPSLEKAWEYFEHVTLAVSGLV